VSCEINRDSILKELNEIIDKYDLDVNFASFLAEIFMRDFMSQDFVVPFVQSFNPINGVLSVEPDMYQLDKEGNWNVKFTDVQLMEVLVWLRENVVK